MVISSHLIRRLIRHRLMESMIMEEKKKGLVNLRGMGEVLKYLQGELLHDSRHYLQLEEVLGVLLEGVEEDWLRRVCKYIIYNLVRTNTGATGQEIQSIGSRLGYREEFNDKKVIKNIKDLNIAEILKGCLIYCRKDEDMGMDSQKVKVMQQHLSDKLKEIKEIFKGVDEFVKRNDIDKSEQIALDKMRRRIQAGKGELESELEIDDISNNKKYFRSDLPTIKGIIMGFLKKKNGMKITDYDREQPIVLSIDNIFGQILNQDDYLNVKNAGGLLKHITDIMQNLNRLDVLDNEELGNLYKNTFKIVFGGLIKSLQGEEYNQKDYHNKKSKKPFLK